MNVIILGFFLSLAILLCVFFFREKNVCVQTNNKMKRAFIEVAIQCAVYQFTNKACSSVDECIDWLREHSDTLKHKGHYVLDDKDLWEIATTAHGRYLSK